MTGVNLNAFAIKTIVENSYKYINDIYIKENKKFDRETLFNELQLVALATKELINSILNLGN